jgi:hypothetical protein
MPSLAIVISAALQRLAIIGYVLTDMVSWTALIPAFLGLPVGLLGSAMGIPTIISLLAGNDLERPAAAGTKPPRPPPEILP